MSDPLGWITGIGQLPSAPRYVDFTYPELLSTVAADAIADAGFEEADVDGVVLSAAPDLLLGVNDPQNLAALGLPAAPLLARVNTAAGSGLSAVRLACAHVAARHCRNVLVAAADIGAQTTDHNRLIWTGLDALRERHVPMNGVSLFAFMSALYMQLFDATEAGLAAVTVKNRRNGVANRFAQLRSEVTLEDVLVSPLVAWPIRRAQIGPAGGGAAALVISAEPGRNGRQVAVAGCASRAAAYSIGDRVARDDPSFGYASEMSDAARTAYDMAGVTPSSIDAAEVYASYPVGELISIEALGLCERGTGWRLLGSGRFDRAGSTPVNLSGGATCGNPLSTTALNRVVEMTRQIRGETVTGRPPALGVVNGFGGVSQLHEVMVLAAT
ncbi:MAG: thiolase family protein [Rhizobiaceae bacterium]